MRRLPGERLFIFLLAFNKSTMGKKIVTFGEMLMRLTTPGNLRLQQSRHFDVNFGGSEGNVAISIASYGGEVSLVTALPDNPLGHVCLMKLREHSVGTDEIKMMKGERLGTYIVEKAADMRAASVIYDRKDSAFARLKPGMIDWNKAFNGAGIFHWSGIDAALTQGLTDVCHEAIDAADHMGLEISCDINYRKNLWQYGKSAEEVLLPLMRKSDIVFGSGGEYEKALGLVAPAFNAAGSSEVIDKHAFEDYCSRVNEKLPRCKHLFIALRNVITSEHHVMAGVLWSGGKLYTTRIYEVNNVIDSMGVGDAFVGAMLYAYQNYADDQAKLDFATAGSVLKNTIVGDYNMVTVNEVEAVIRGGSAEMKR